MGTASGDDVVYVGSSTSNPSLKNEETIPCQLCSEDLTKLDPDARQRHYDGHAEKDSIGGSSSLTQRFMEPVAKARAKLVKEPSDDVFWYPSKGTPPPSNVTPSLIPFIRKQLTRMNEKGKVQKAHLCFEKAVHVSHNGWDQGWGCGYRNFMMACANLIECHPTYISLLDDAITPGVRDLQKWIEKAWKDGFDLEGATQLKNQLFNTQKWLGTSDLWVALSSRGIPCELVDFEFKKNKKDRTALIKWMVDYFDGNDKKPTTLVEALMGSNPVVNTGKMPLILQHKRHSRTIIGFMRTSSGIDFLMFDPSPLSTSTRMTALQASSRSPGTQSEPSLASRFLPARLLERFSSTRSEERKRKASDTDETAASNAVKRIKEDKVIVIDSDDEAQPGPSQRSGSKEELDPATILKPFILKAETLQSQDAYQILYFPLTEPLSEQEKRARRVVISTKAAV